ncbi:hypothetical protein B23_2301 [Geobacillus thermoleovorans B23]|nr:hypothetical protein B23_2301 [Geobacillus thermoleovorans B23]
MSFWLFVKPFFAACIPIVRVGLAFHAKKARQTAQ